MSDPLLSVRGLKISFAGIKAIRHVDLRLDDRELICIIGPNGAGKTTLLNLLSGTLRPQAGQIRFTGYNLIGLPAYRFARLGIIRKFQVPNVFGPMSARENLEVAMLGAGGRAGSQDGVAEILELTGLGDLAETGADALAHGQKQWLEIGMALVCRPNLLLLDEPSAGMSAEETQELAEVVSKLKDQAIVVIEHDMNFVRSLGCRTVVMHQGEIICDDRFSAVEKDPLVCDVYLGRK